MMGGMPMPGVPGAMGMRPGLLAANGPPLMGSASGKMTGTVKWYNPEKGYGFIICASTGKDLFAHQTELKNAPALVENQFVEFTMQTKNGSRGKRKLSDGSYAEGVAKLSRGQYPNDFQ